MAVNGHANGHSGSALCSVREFCSEQYDYVIIGGGTAGLAVAARLTENGDVKVGVIEAGANRMDDPQVYTPSLYPTLIGREVRTKADAVCGVFTDLAVRYAEI